jgi:hypothetical protein
LTSSASHADPAASFQKLLHTRVMSSGGDACARLDSAVDRNGL